MTEQTGRCLCGAVSYKLTTEPLITRVCWCRDCQHQSANGTVNVVVPTEGLTVFGKLTEYRKPGASGNEVIRQFCPVCGTHLVAMSSVRPQFRVIRAGTLDDPSSVRPVLNMWASSAPVWACLDAELERVEHQPLPPTLPANNTVG